MIKNERLPFEDLSFYIRGGANLLIRIDRSPENLFQGSLEELHMPHNRELHNRLSDMEVLGIDAENGMLIIDLNGD